MGKNPPLANLRSRRSVAALICPAILHACDGDPPHPPSPKVRPDEPRCPRSRQELAGAPRCPR
eukprot:9475099-Pyramimonas_sp.AAC.1